MSLSDAVEYLVLRMFPAKLVNQARIEVGDGKSRDDAKAYIEKVNIYERALRALSDESLVALVEDERRQDTALLQEREEQLDRHRFFNVPEASANFARWAKRPCWTLDEATALILGKCPETVDWAHIEPLVGVSPLAARFSEIRRHMMHARDNGQLFDPVAPAHFLTWANERGVVLPQALEGCIAGQRSDTISAPVADQDDCGAVSETTMVSDGGDGLDERTKSKGDTKVRRHKKAGDNVAVEPVTIIHFSRHKDRLRAMAERMKAADERTAEIENDITGEATDGLVKMTIAMAIGRYGFEPGRGRDSTVADIVRDLEKVSLSLSPATIRNWLREASACLPDGIDREAEDPLGRQQG